MGSASRSICAALISGALLVGCAATGADSPAPSKSVTSERHARSWMLPEAARENLMYVSDPGSGNVMVYGYPPNGLKFVGLLTGNEYPQGECVDASQNVWVAAGATSASFVLYRYPHAATSPDAVLSDPAGAPYGCAVNRANGNLAVTATSEGGPSLPIAIYSQAKGKPKLYSYPYLYGRYLTYDDKGNLFVVGIANDDNLKLVELPKGGSALQLITVPQSFKIAGGIAWDGTYIVIADAGTATVYRFTIHGSSAREVDAFPVTGANTIEQLTVDGDRALVPSIVTHGSGVVSLFRYPAGGERIRTLRNFSQPYAAVISRGPKE
jgi:DNA-binding beta-propeller fold protein YncE